MKKFLLLMCVALMSMVCVAAVAQEVIDPENPVEAGWGFGTFTALTALVALVIPFAVELLKRFFPDMPSLVKQVVSWLIGVLIAYAGWLLKLGFLVDLSWWVALFYGLGAGLVANGVFDTGMFTKIFELLFGKKEGS